ncbi:MAG: TauD/TfdA family dioxygenase [Pseudomonadota bacterium]|nr:TauD/TfdA family dioxygenase [Pseudomonadota bacterium]
MTYKTISLSTLTPKLGAEVIGADLADLTDELIGDIKRAFREHFVLVFRDQSLTREAHKAFGRAFGELQTHPAKTNLGLPGDPEIFDINITAKTEVANGESWHTDLSCEPIPPMASALYITEVPPSGGGDTLFANMLEAYAALSDEVKGLLEGLTAYHDGYKDLRAYGFEAKPGQTYPCASHPVVIKHPDTGDPVLFVNEPFTSHINELSANESEALLDMLYRQIETSKRFHCRVKWQPNMVVLWDNRAVHHHAVWDYYPESRRGERVTVRQASAPTAYV